MEIEIRRETLVADPDLSELRRGPGFVLLSQLAVLPSVISSFFTQNTGGRGAPFQDLPLNSVRPPLPLSS